MGCCGRGAANNAQGLARNGKLVRYQFTDPEGNVSIHKTTTDAKISRNTAGGGLIQVVYVDPETES